MQLRTSTYREFSPALGLKYGSKRQAPSARESVVRSLNGSMLCGKPVECNWKLNQLRLSPKRFESLTACAIPAEGSASRFREHTISCSWGPEFATGQAEPNGIAAAHTELSCSVIPKAVILDFKAKPKAILQALAPKSGNQVPDARDQPVGSNAKLK
jgi:hypothetical protein